MGVLVNALKNSSNINNHLIPGVQAVGINSALNNVSHYQQGAAQSFLDNFDIPSNEMTIERVMSDIDRLWLEKSSENLWDHNNFTSVDQYKNSFILKRENFGTSINSLSDRASVQSSILPEFDIRMIYKDMNSSVIGSSGFSGTALDIIEMPKCLLSSLSYSFDASGGFTESIGLVGKEFIKKTSNEYSFDTRGGSQIATDSSFVNLLKRENFDLQLSVLPQSLISCIDFQDYLNGAKILGINSAEISVSFNYSQDSSSIWNQGDRVNEFTTLDLNNAIEIECSFNVTARRGIQISTLLRDNNVQDERICIVLKTKNPYATGFKFFIFNLGNKNRLRSIMESDGSTSGSIVNYTFTYSNTKNDFVTYTQSQESEGALNPPLFQQTTESY